MGRASEAIRSREKDVREIEYRSPADDTMQPAIFHSPKSKVKRPLLVGLHTWGQDYTMRPEEHGGGALAVEKGWVFIYPNFRGANDRPEATGSELVVKDIIGAVEYCRKNASVDEERIYLLGCSGGGYTALLMAGRAPGTWAGVSAWVPISNLKAWYIESKAGRTGYEASIAKSCGGDPTSDAGAEAEAARRSPVTYLKDAQGVRLDIWGGITDDVVPFSHSLRAFNAVAEAKDRIAEEEIKRFLASRKVPAGLQGSADDGKGDVIFRRQSGKARVTIFDGGHTLKLERSIEWLEEQRKGK